MELVNLGSLAGAKEYAVTASLSTSMNAGTEGRLPAEIEPPNCPQWIRLSMSPKELVPLV